MHRVLQQSREFMKEDRDLNSLDDGGVGIELTAEFLQQDARHGLNFLVSKQADA